MPHDHFKPSERDQRIFRALCGEPMLGIERERLQRRAQLEAAADRRLTIILLAALGLLLCTAFGLGAFVWLHWP